MLNLIKISLRLNNIRKFSQSTVILCYKRDKFNKYEPFVDEFSNEILDVDEERKLQQQQTKIITKDDDDEYLDDLKEFNLKRGKYGVFDIEDLVEVLRKENAQDLFVCTVPKSLKYVDYMVICSGRSYRHMLAMAEYTRRIFKIKRHKEDILPRIEGKNSRDWMAMDLGNIALHIMSKDTRETYDLESLWAIGREYDIEYNKPLDPLVELFEKHSILLADVKKNDDTMSSTAKL